MHAAILLYPKDSTCRQAVALPVSHGLDFGSFSSEHNAFYASTASWPQCLSLPTPLRRLDTTTSPCPEHPPHARFPCCGHLPAARPAHRPLADSDQPLYPCYPAHTSHVPCSALPLPLLPGLHQGRQRLRPEGRHAQPGEPWFSLVVGGCCRHVYLLDRLSACCMACSQTVSLLHGMLIGWTGCQPDAWPVCGLDGLSTCQHALPT